MKKRSVKQLGLGLISLGILGGLAACGNGNSSAEGEADEGKTLTVSVDSGYKDYINEIKNTFEKENDVKIKLVEKDMFDQLESLALDGPAGKGPDVMMAAYDRIGALGQQGHLAEVKLGNEAAYDETDKAQDLVDTAPSTFKDLENLSKDSRFAFESEAGKNTGFLAKWTDFYYSYGLIAGYGGYVFGDDGTNPSDIGLNNAGAVEGISYATDWFKNVWPKGMQDIKSAGDFASQQFMSNKTAAIIDGPWQAQTYKENNINYGVAKIPTLNNGQPYQPFGGGKGWVVSNYAKNKDLSQKWLDYVTNQENQEKFFEMVNEIPANQQARETAKAKNDELTTAVIEQYETAQAMPNIPEMGEVWTGAENLMFDAASGSKTPKESADEAVKTISEAIEQKY